jgi:hypothetical protein
MRAPWHASADRLRPLDGGWAGHREDGGRRSPLRLTLRCCDGLIVGSGVDRQQTVDIFGLYGAESGHVALLLTASNGTATDLDGETCGVRVVGTWLDETGATGEFALRPVECEAEWTHARPATSHE